MSQEQLLLLLGVSATVSMLISLILAGWEFGKGKEVQTKQVMWLWLHRILTILLSMAYVFLAFLFSIRMIP